MNFIRKIIRFQDSPIYLLLFIALVAGLFIYGDFGASWDEPEYYQYADTTLKAYSVRDLANGQYSLESAYGPGDLRYYGPSFLILGKGFFGVLKLVLPNAYQIDIWHLTIYLFFLMGIFFFYKLALRLTSRAAAISSSALLLTQPVLFGNAWINPKDIPLLVFFLGAIYFGVIFSDRIETFNLDWKGQSYPEAENRNPWLSIKGLRKTIFVAINLMLILSSSLLVFFSDQVKKGLSDRILMVNINSSKTFFDNFFLTLVRNYQKVPLSYYAEKSAGLFNHFLFIFILFTILFTTVFLYLHRFPNDYRIRWKYFKINVSLFWLTFKKSKEKNKIIFNLLAACLFLAFSSATRLIGPLAGFLVLLYWIIQFRWKALPFGGAYFLLSLPLFYIQWPYIWKDTWNKLVFVLQHMSNNPVGVNVLFGGTTYNSRNLPAGYFFGLIGVTLTEPALILILAGFLFLLIQIIRERRINPEWLIPTGWFLIPFIYILVSRPPMYDNYRHFLFLLPALFFFAAAIIQRIFDLFSPVWIKFSLVILLILPGIFGIIRLHPYEYSYYNLFVGEVSGAENKFELDYWLTCYRELGKEIEGSEARTVDVYVDLAPDLASLYNYQRLRVNSINSIPFSQNGLVILHKRWDHILLYEDFPIAYEVQLDGVVLCIARRVP